MIVIQQIGVREFTKDFNKLQDIDIIEIVDKKTNNLKGIYLSQKQAKEFQEYLKEKKEKETQKKINKLIKYAGSIEIDNKFKDLSNEELKVAIAKAKAGITDE